MYSYMNFNDSKNFLRHSDGKIQIRVSSVQAYIVKKFAHNLCRVALVVMK